MWQLILAQAQEAAQGTATDAPTGPFGGGGSQFMIMMVALLAIMYFLMIRPNQKREKDRKEMLAAVAKGDKVVTSGGICGSVVGLSEKTVVLKVSDEPNVKMEFLRGAISQVTSKASQEKD